jgi:hypothetical protein
MIVKDCCYYALEYLLLLCIRVLELITPLPGRARDWGLGRDDLRLITPTYRQLRHKQTDTPIPMTHDP